MSNGFVLDASVAVGWAFDDEVSEASEKAFQRLCDDYACVPSFWSAEVANAFVSGLRKQRIDAVGVEEFVADLGRLDIRAEHVALPLDALVEFAAATGLSGYDAAYVQLALEQGLPLASADRRMCEVAHRLGVHLI